MDICDFVSGKTFFGILKFSVSVQLRRQILYPCISFVTLYPNACVCLKVQFSTLPKENNIKFSFKNSKISFVTFDRSTKKYTVHRQNFLMIYILSNSDMFWLTNNHFQGAVTIIKVVHITERNVHGIYTWIH